MISDKRDQARDLHALGVEPGLVLELAAALGHQVEHGPDVFGGGKDAQLAPRLLDVLDLRGVRQRRRAVDGQHRAVRLEHLILHRGRGEDDVHVILALEPFLDDLHVEQAQKAKPVAKAKRLAALRLVRERGIVELQLLQRIAQVVVVVRVARVEAGKDHRLERAVAGQLLRRRLRRQRDRVAHVEVLQRLQPGGDIAYLARVSSLIGSMTGTSTPISSGSSVLPVFMANRRGVPSMAPSTTRT